MPFQVAWRGLLGCSFMRRTWRTKPASAASRSFENTWVHACAKNAPAAIVQSMVQERSYGQHKGSPHTEGQKGRTTGKKRKARKTLKS